jgi:uncharacterized repeat protein (TIGR03803 family)
MKMGRSISMSIALFLAVLTVPCYGGLIHYFTGGADGENPNGGLILSGSTLLGVTANGGVGYGTIFAIQTDGTKHKVLYNFTAQPDGAAPIGNLVLSGPTNAAFSDSTLYGITNYGGANNQGSIFSFSTKAGKPIPLHSFGNAQNDGIYPLGSPVLVGSVLIGTTSQGGKYSKGIIFSVNTDGSSYTILHHFGDPQVANDGTTPGSVLVRSGTTLFGTTDSGGQYGFGTIYSISTDGKVYTPIYHFDAKTGKGHNPWVGLCISGSTLYGMTHGGPNCSAAGCGVIFSFDTNKKNYNVLHDLGKYKEGQPAGVLVISGFTLYGLTDTVGGQSCSGTGCGTIFSIDTNGNNHKVLHSFPPTWKDKGWKPVGLHIGPGSTLYGTTSSGGERNFGSIFSF